jgi:DNA-binding PadR family transcriptional regulator
MSIESSLPLSVPAFQILVSLAEGPLHGYAMLQEIRDRTGGRVDLTASTLYGALRRMVEDGWVEEATERPAPHLDDSRRKYFALSTLGRDVARAETHRLQSAAADALRRGLAGGATE